MDSESETEIDNVQWNEIESSEFKKVNTSDRKDLWSEEETQQLQELVTAFGQKWVKICKELTGRTPEQCSAKWYRSHQSKLDATGWTVEECKILEESYHELGGKWVAISKRLPKRTDKAVRNKFMRTIKNVERLSDDHSKKTDFPTSIPYVYTSVNFANLEAGKVYESSATALFSKEHTRKRPRKDSSSSSSSSQTIDELLANASSATAQISSDNGDPSGGLITMMANSNSKGDEDANSDILMQISMSRGQTATTPAKKSRKTQGDGHKYNSSKWNPHEDEALSAAVVKNGEDWEVVSMEIGGSRTAQQCAGRYNGHLSLKHKKGIWAVEENETLVSLVNHMGLSSWTDIAKRLPGRTPKQCNAKWYRSLNPEIVRNQWSNEENLILKQAHAQFGSKWAELSRLLPGRTDKSVRNHWLCSLHTARHAPFMELPEHERPNDAFGKNFISFSAEELDLNLNNGEALHIRKKDDPPAIVQNFWTAAEDVRLEQLVIDMGFKWAAISKKLGEGLHPRKQCRDRFLFYLKKDTMRNPWTEVEQMQLLKAQHRSGNKWVEFAKIIQTHSADAVRHYWRSYMRSLTENYLTITGKVKRDALVSNYNFDQVFVNMLLTEEDFQQIMAYIRIHDLEKVSASETMGDVEEEVEGDKHAAVEV